MKNVIRMGETKMSKKIIWFNLLIVFILIVNSSIVFSAERASGLSVSLLEYSPQPVQPGQVMDLYLQITNTGDPTKDTTLEIIEEYPFTLEHSQDLERAKNLGSVVSTQILQFRIRIEDGAKDGIVPLRVRYKVNTDDEAYIEESFDINIQTFDARLDIVDIKQFPEDFIPGDDDGKLIFTLRNDDDRPLKNIDVVLDLTNSYNANTNMENMLAMQAMVNARLEEVNRRIASGLSPLKGPTPMMAGDSGMGDIGGTNFEALAPIGSSNQKRIAALGAHETLQITFEIMALPDIAPNVYAVPLYINYNDEDNNPFHIRLDIPVKVNMKPELYVDMSSTSLRTTDFSGSVEFTVANRGLSELRYVTLELEEDDHIELLTAPRSIYLGGLAPGESKTGEFNVITHNRNISFPVKVSYRDSFNEEFKEERSIPFYIINKNYYRDLPYEMWLAWLILGAVVLGLTIFYVRHLSRAKKEY
jgi:hypothetical protein